MQPCAFVSGDINKGDEIYIAYGSDYWDSDTKAKYQLEKNKFKRMTGLIKKKIINKYNYIQKTSKVKKELESIEIPVCPSFFFLFHENYCYLFGQAGVQALKWQEPMVYWNTINREGNG